MASQTQSTLPVTEETRWHIVSDTFSFILKIWFSVILFAGVLGNALTIIAILVCKRHRRTHNAYICSLAFADLIVCITVVPYSIWLLEKGSESYDHILCKPIALLAVAMLCCTLYNLAGIAINRYVCILRPQHVYMKLYTKNRVTISIISIWLLAGLIVTPGLLGFGFYGYNDLFGSCVIMYDHITYLMVQTILHLLCVFPSIFIIFFSYISIIVHFRRVTQRATEVPIPPAVSSMTEENSSEGSKKEVVAPTPSESKPIRSAQQHRIIANLCVVFGVFLGCWMPMVSIYVIDYHAKAPVWLYRIFFILATSNSCVNIFIYAGMNRAFRKTYVLILTGKWRQINSQF